MRKYLPHILIISFVFLLAPSGCNISKFNLKIDKLQSEVRKNPDYAKAHYKLGNAYYNTGKFQEAIKSYKQALRIDPDDAEVHFNLGLTYLQLNDRGSALEQYEILKSLESGLANELFNAIYE